MAANINTIHENETRFLRAKCIEIVNKFIGDLLIA